MFQGELSRNLTEPKASLPASVLEARSFPCPWAARVLVFFLVWQKLG